MHRALKTSIGDDAEQTGPLLAAGSQTSGPAEAPVHPMTQTAGQLIPGLLQGPLCAPGATRCPLISLVCDCGPTTSLMVGRAS